MGLTIQEIQWGDAQDAKNKKSDISRWLQRTFGEAVKSRSTQIETKLKRWCDNYAAQPAQAIRTTPFYKASNFVPQLIRMHTDILSARTLGIIFGTKPFWRPKSFNNSIPNDMLNGVGSYMEYVCANELNFFQTVDTSVFLGYKTGTTTIKAPWQKDSKYIIVPNENARAAHKEIVTEGIEMDPIAFDDFFPYPITAPSLRHCSAKFHRLRFTREQVEFRMNTGWWDKEGTKRLLQGGGGLDEGSARQSEAAAAGISLTIDVSRPFTAVEAWVDYELEKGKIFPIVVIFNPYDRSDAGILKAYYNYYQSGDMDPFIDIRPMPRENLYFGYSIPEILEQSQEEQAQIHNSRRDASTIANVPAWKKKRLADVANPSTEWYPGKVFEVDSMDDINPLVFGTTYNSLVEEENFLMGLTERYTGVSPAMQGSGSGSLNKRGVYASQGTMAMLAEGNKRLDIYIRRMRNPFHKMGRIIWESYRDFLPQGDEYAKWGDEGKLIQAAFAAKLPPGRKGPFFELSASEASANKEVDRTALLLMSNTMSAYYSHILSLSQMAVQVKDGTPLKELIFQVMDGAKDLADRLLFVFDIQERKKLAVDPRKALQPQPPMGGGSPAGLPGSTDEAGMPPVEGDVSNDQLSGLSGRIAALQSIRRQGAAEPQEVG